MIGAVATYNFEDYVNEANQARDVETLFAVFRKVVARHGYDRSVFVLYNDHLDIGVKAEFGIMQNYPSDWVSHYHANGYKYNDPVILYSGAHEGSFYWRDIPDAYKATKLQRAILEDGTHAGLYNGMCASLRGPNFQRGGIGLATSEQKDAVDDRLDLLHAYCNHFYIAYRRIMRAQQGLDSEIAQDVILSARERDVLRWASLGKTDAEIALIMGISKNTVDTHMRKIFRKLDVNNRILAAVKAVTLGLVNF